MSVHFVVWGAVEKGALMQARREANECEGNGHSRALTSSHSALNSHRTSELRKAGRGERGVGRLPCRAVLHDVGGWDECQRFSLLLKFYK